jgi:lipid-binding SYLF domain-containing protein
MAESAREMRRSASQALESLYSSTPASRALGEQAAGVLVFPEILKGGFIVAAQYGNGVLFKKGKTVGYYNTTSGSFGFQAGVQSFGYALFFMTNDDLGYLETSMGWELGVGPSITIVDVGIARSLSTTTARKGMYAFFFDQKGLMGGLGLQGTKITRIHPKK